MGAILNGESASFSRFLRKVSVTLGPYPSACLKPSPKLYEFPRDTQEADINQIVMTRMGVRHEREKMYTPGKPTMSLPQRNKVRG
jgi:hypothetical protein